MTVTEVVEREVAKLFTIPDNAPDTVKWATRRQVDDLRAACHTVARAVVEECAKAACQWCCEGYPLLEALTLAGPTGSHHICKGRTYENPACAAYRIRLLADPRPEGSDT